MFSASKKKFAVLAKKFFSTSRKRRKAATKIVRNAHGPSTLNLLDDNDDEDLIDVNGGDGAERDMDVLFEPLVSYLIIVYQCTILVFCFLCP